MAGKRKATTNARKSSSGRTPSRAQAAHQAAFKHAMKRCKEEGLSPKTGCPVRQYIREFKERKAR